MLSRRRRGRDADIPWARRRRRSVDTALVHGSRRRRGRDADIPWARRLSDVAARSRPARASGTLVCPKGAKEGTPLLFKDNDGHRFSTIVPKGVRPGQKFIAHRTPLDQPGFTGADGASYKRVASQSKLAARLPTPMPRPGTGSARSARSARTARSGMSSRPRTGAFRPNTPLGDQEWWEQYGFKGAVSEEKKRERPRGIENGLSESPRGGRGDAAERKPDRPRDDAPAGDYGNGVPNWSPYHVSTDTSEKPPVGLPADAYWFEQWGFRTAQLSEDAIRCQGYGVPMWSPYYKNPVKMPKVKE